MRGLWQRLAVDAEARVDLALAAVMTVVGLAMVIDAIRLPPPFFDPLGSGAVPKYVGLVIMALSYAILAHRLTLPAPTAAEPDGLSRPTVAAQSIAIMLAYAGVMEVGWLGFREATIPAVILLAGVLSHWNRQVLLFAVVAAVAIALSFAWLFSEILYVDLPVSPFLDPVR
jgi:putative tricarboxylic transport membrane protein